MSEALTTSAQPNLQGGTAGTPAEPPVMNADEREQGEQANQMEGMTNENTGQDNNARTPPGSPMELTDEITTFVFPEPMGLAELPEFRDENPHLQKSQWWPSPTKTPANWTTPFTQAIWPRAVFAAEILLRNVCEKHRVDIQDDQTETVLAIFFGARPASNAKHPDQVRQLLEVLETVQKDIEKAHEGETGYAEQDDAIDAELAEPKRKSEGDIEQHPFNSPWVVVLKIARADVRNFLVHRQTMAWDKVLTAHFVTLDLTVKSWVIAHLQCNAVKDTDVARTHMLGSIKKALWADKVYRKIVNVITSPMAEFTGSLNERVYESTRTLDLMYVSYIATAGERAGQKIELYILLGKPLTNNLGLHKKWLDAIRRANLHMGIQTVKTQEVFTDCNWCKSPMHPTEVAHAGDEVGDVGVEALAAVVLEEAANGEIVSTTAFAHTVIWPEVFRIPKSWNSCFQGQKKPPSIDLKDSAKRKTNGPHLLTVYPTGMVDREAEGQQTRVEGGGPITRHWSNN
ncbi:hypothetical protein FISHEDRAFT_70263 [Fistulina hepatica ATCC 64428]|uniref:Uncharacterized protein n=1 Tax=Fistulina hepatica ATCC 64428 TaxID=1128425 RepID=A0A0D7AJU0_9AGAR|nr:hypothetical protein FISHEDRAFT_70263 [Fistulina hepatica ATCC 64428]